MKRLYWSCGGCYHCGRTDKPLTTLTPLRFGRPFGSTKHLCPNCYEAVAEVTWIIDERPRPRPKVEEVWAP